MRCTACPGATAPRCRWLFIAMIGSMREAKARLHPGDRRIVTELEVERGPLGIRVRAEWAQRS